jgi:Fe-S cluster biogenesis protein NfuA
MANQDSRPAPGGSLQERVQRVINEIRPAIQRDGGDIVLVDVTADGEVRVQLQGACVGCPMSQMTLTMGVERRVREMVPEVSRVVMVPFESSGGGSCASGH